MDITLVFKTQLDLLHRQDNELDHFTGSVNPSKATKPLFPNRRPQKTEFGVQAEELRKYITDLRNMVQSSRNAYLTLSSYLISNNNSSLSSATVGMSDKERDELDSTVEVVISNCQLRLTAYDEHIRRASIDKPGQQGLHPQVMMHLDCVLTSLQSYLKEVCTLYSEMRAIRVKRTVDYQTMSHLNTMVNNPIKARYDLDKNGQIRKTDDDKSTSTRRQSKSAFAKRRFDMKQLSSAPTHQYDEENSSNLSQLTPEEMQMLEEENALLINNLSTLTEEVNQIQTSVVAIAQLQEIFTEKVLQQDKDVDRVAQVIVGTSENIRGGNEQIRQAIQRNADFRAWILFFILVMSFTILFLDWYNA